MNKILLHCESLEESQKLRELYEKHLPYPIYHSFDGRSVERLISRNVINLTVVECAQYGISQHNMIQDLRGGGYFRPILVLPDELPALAKNATEDDESRSRLHFITKPIDERTVIGVTKKLLIAREVPQQLHHRFSTNQLTIMEVAQSGEYTMSNMYNLSKGGAYCEYDDKFNVSIGEVVKIRVHLQEVSKERTLPAKVVWKTREGAYSGRNGIGVRFFG